MFKGNKEGYARAHVHANVVMFGAFHTTGYGVEVKQTAHSYRSCIRYVTHHHGAPGMRPAGSDRW